MIILLFILDGCAINSYIKAQTPFIDSLSEKGFISFNCKTVFPTATYTGHSTIVTGTFPEQHGMIGNQFFDSNDKKVKHFDYYDPSEYIQTQTLFEMLKSLRTMAVAEPITKGADYTFSMKELNKIPLEERDELIFDKSLKLLRDYNIKFGVINFAGVDGYGETFGPDNKKYLDEISKCDHFLSKIYEIIDDKLIMIITADHGMTKVSRRFDLKSYFQKEGISSQFLESHRACHIYSNENNKEIIEELNQLKEIDKIFLKSQTKDIKLHHKRTGDIVISANKGIEFEKENLNGSHGGYLKEEVYVPLIIISKNYKLKYPPDYSSRTYSTLDVAPTILKISNMQLKTNLPGSPI
ncbi:MAG: alkaline phosphatase family protein [Candidatus Helarchaeota archaeon]|nr:alkaline phosphatase family protein [Candidatus Helarchaeota archaeon]